MTATRPASPGRRKQWDLISILAWVGVVALILWAVYRVRENRSLQEELVGLQAEVRVQRDQNRALAHDRQLHEQALAILGASGTKEVVLKASGKTSLPAVRAYWNAEKGLVLTGRQIPLPGTDRTFQLWVVPKKGNPIGAGIFRPDAAGQVLFVVVPDAPLAATAALEISDEPASGSPQPTTTPLWVGAVS